MTKYEKLAPFNTGKKDRFFEVRARDFGWRCVSNGHAVVAVRDLRVTETTDEGAWSAPSTLTGWLDETMPVPAAAKLLDLGDLRAAFGEAGQVRSVPCEECHGTALRTPKHCGCTCDMRSCDCCTCPRCHGDREFEQWPSRRDVSIGGVGFDANLVACALEVIARSVGTVAAWVHQGDMVVLRSDSLFVAVMRLAADSRTNKPLPIAIPVVLSEAA